MGLSIFSKNVVVCGIATSYSESHHGQVTAHQRAPTDPFYYADVVVENIVVGSEYLLGYTPAGGEFTPLGFSGTVTGTPGETTALTLSNVPSYASPMLLELRVRKSSASPKYKPLVQYANHSPNGTNMYLAQQLDPIQQ